MIITKEYCDRCGKEVKSGPLDQKLFPIICRSGKAYIRFRQKLAFTEETKMVCEECLKDFHAWWNKTVSK